MNTTSILILIGSATSFIALVIFGFKIQRRDADNLAKSLTASMPIDVLTLKRNVSLSSIGVPLQVLQGRFGRVNLDPLAHVVIEEKSAYLAGYRNSSTSFDIYANRAMVIIDFEIETTVGIVTCGRGVRSKVVEDIDGIEKCEAFIDRGKNYHIFAGSKVASQNGGGEVVGKQLAEIFPMSFFENFRIVEWAEIGEGHIVLVGPRKITSQTFEQLCLAAKAFIKRTRNRSPSLTIPPA